MQWWIIFFFIISIIFLIITMYYLGKQEKLKKQIEHFESQQNQSIPDQLQSQHQTKVTFLSATESQKLITKTGPYFQNMNQPNLMARDCKSLDELYHKYLTAFDDITPLEKQTIQNFILALLDELKSRNQQYYNYVKYWINRIEISKAKPWLESGMPHTLENVIIMDANWFQNPRKSTFIHEITHVHQRITPFEFEELYPKLGYLEYRCNLIKGLESTLQLNRNNPDGLSSNWLWSLPPSATTSKPGVPVWWWIGALFHSATPGSVNDASNIALKLERDPDGKFYYLKQQPQALEQLEAFIKFFGNNPNNYHPNEMSARYSEWLLEDNLGISGVNKRQDKRQHEGYNIYKQHFTNIINTYYQK